VLMSANDSSSNEGMRNDSINVVIVPSIDATSGEVLFPCYARSRF
jgi:hypothetical protein